MTEQTNQPEPEEVTKAENEAHDVIERRNQKPRNLKGRQ